MFIELDEINSTLLVTSALLSMSSSQSQIKLRHPLSFAVLTVSFAIS